MTDQHRPCVYVCVGECKPEEVGRLHGGVAVRVYVSDATQDFTRVTHVKPHSTKHTPNALLHLLLLYLFLFLLRQDGPRKKGGLKETPIDRQHG